MVLIPMQKDNAWFWLDLRQTTDETPGMNFAPTVYHPLMISGNIRRENFQALMEGIPLSIKEDMENIFEELTKTIVVGKPPNVVGLETYHDLYDYSAFILLMFFRKLALGLSVICF